MDVYTKVGAQELGPPRLIGKTHPKQYQEIGF